MDLKKIKAGMKLYDCRMQSGMIQGLRDACTWPVYVKEVSPDGEKFLCSWNGNPPRWIYPYQVKRYRLKPRPVIKGRISSRFATREEIKAMAKENT